MLIFEEWERQEKEVSKEMEEQADEYHEHLEYEHWRIDRVVHEEDEPGPSESGDEEEGTGGKIIIQTFNDDLEEEMVRQLKHGEEETK